MVSLEQFCYGAAGCYPEELGEVGEIELPVELLVATRPYLNERRIGGGPPVGVRGHRSLPEVIVLEDVPYLVDGHHKAKRAFDEGVNFLLCRALITESIRVAEKLERRGVDFIGNIQIGNV